MDKQRRLKKATEFYSNCMELDGWGLVVTDNDMLAERVAEWFDLKPEEINPQYGE